MAPAPSPGLGSRPPQALPPALVRRLVAGLLVLAVLTGAALKTADTLAAGEEQPKSLSIFAPRATYSVQLKERDKIDYVPLIDLLEPLGTFTASKAPNRDWELKLNGVEGQFSEGKTQTRVRGTTFELASPVITENGRPYVPLKSVFHVLYHL